MKCFHKDDDGASSIVSGKCGICGSKFEVQKQENNSKTIYELEKDIHVLEEKNKRYVEENKRLRDLVRTMSSFI